MQEILHSPTLNTVIMVENTLKNMDESVITIAELKRKLPRQVNHNTLRIILEYLELSNKIVVTMKGITWIHNANPRLQKELWNHESFPRRTSRFLEDVVHADRR